MLYIFPDYRKLSEEAAEFIARKGLGSIEERGRFAWVLSGGHTPRGAYEVLGERAGMDRGFWTSTHIFWGDERCVPPDHPHSNYFGARESLLLAVPVPSEQIHRIPAEMADRERAAQAYESVFPGQPDLVLLGMGNDGHVASLFPHSRVLLETQRRFAVSEAPAEPKYRITLTPPAIATAREVLVLVSGASKSGALRRVFADEGDVEETPARLVRNATWFVDRAAAKDIFELRISGVARVAPEAQLD